MKIIFFGLGSIGSRHAKLLQENFDHEIYAFDVDKKKSKNELGIKVVYTWEDVKKIKPDIAFITNPTFLHISTAIKCAELGMHLFIEKPLSNTQEGIDQLKEIVKSKNLKSYVAYCLRFHPVIRWLKDYLKDKTPLHVRVATTSFLPDWRPGQDHKKSYCVFKEKGGGVILELSHEIDYLAYLFGEIENIKVHSSRISNITVDSEDFADLLIQFKKTFCNLHLNFISQDLKREISLDLEDEFVKADLINNKITIMKDKKTKEISFDLERDDIYLAQLKHFFGNLDKKTMNNLEEAEPILKYILRSRGEVK